VVWFNPSENSLGGKGRNLSNIQTKSRIPTRRKYYEELILRRPRSGFRGEDRDLTLEGSRPTSGMFRDRGTETKGYSTLDSGKRPSIEDVEGKRRQNLCFLDENSHISQRKEKITGQEVRSEGWAVVGSTVKEEQNIQMRGSKKSGYI